MGEVVDSSFIEDLPKGPLDSYRSKACFDWKCLKLVFEDVELLKIKIKMWKTLQQDPLFSRSNVRLTTEEMKRKTALQLHRYRQYNFLPSDIQQLPYKKKTRYLMTVNEALAASFPCVSVKHAVGISLFKNTLTTLGTERHSHVLDSAWKGQIVACLALTEVAHGSNTKQMRTTATYDQNTKEFILNTPDFESAKCWVGNLGKSCTLAILFAQLYTQGQCYGLHAFLVPIRDPHTMLPYPGILVGDVGEKTVLHGLDNGFLMFNNYRIPRENLLNRTADVTENGEYESSFTDPGRILGAALENLSTGRVGVIQENVNTLINAVTIAVRYAALRKQFSDKDSVEVPIIEYQLHQWRLFRYVSAAAVFKLFTYSFTNDYLTVVEQSTTSDQQLEHLNDLVAEIHAQISCIKPLITWTSRDACRECREACGGHGILRASGLGYLKEVNDPSVTYEGDNNVLIQQTSNWLLRQWRLLNQEGNICSPLGSCDFLVKGARQKTFEVNSISQLMDVNVISSCYEWLIIYLLDKTHTHQSTLIAQGLTTFSARNNSQVYRASTLALAYAEYNALRHYWRRVKESPNSVRPVLDRLGLLYGLSRLDEWMIYLYEGNFVTGGQAAALVKEAILVLCKELLPDVMGVVDALAPPDFVLNSVLGKADGKLYENLQSTFLHGKDALSRPDWWQEIVIPNAPDLHLTSKL